MVSVTHHRDAMYAGIFRKRTRISVSAGGNVSLCHTIHGRDINAAINIREKGIQMILHA